MALTAVYDACVLYPAPLRDLLMRLALTDLFRAKWTDRIHDEWIRTLVAKRPELAPHLQRTRELMNTHARDCLVTGHEHLIPRLVLPDPDDRHVLAAAIKTRADIIVTFNTKDFPKTCLQEFGIEAKHPDEFVVDLLDLAPGTVHGAVKRHRLALKTPPKSIIEYLDTLHRQGLTGTVARLQAMSDNL